MTSIDATAGGMLRGTSAPALAFALRELRGGLRGFYVLIACIALGVMAIAGVGSFARSLTDGIAREGRVILGGDLAFSIIHREASAEERAFLASQGKVSGIATLRAMVRSADHKLSLIELKAIDNVYPLTGSVAVEPDMLLPAVLAERNGAFGAIADPALLTRLDLKPGARLTLGAATLEITATLKSEPDKLAAGIAFGPRVIVSDAALRATGLLQPGSLVRWHYRLLLADAGESAMENVIASAHTRFPDAGWEIRSRTNASPSLERNVERFTQFLTLVGLAALLVGGVGVANAVKSHLDRKREVIATLKSLGATGGRVFAIYLVQVMALAAVGAAIGLVLGALLPFVIAAAFGTILPLPISPALHPAELALALLYGCVTALAFSLWPLGRAHDVPVSALFRDEVASDRRWPRLRYALATVLTIAALAALAVTLAYDRRIAAIFVGAAAVVFLALQLISVLLMAMARRLPHSRMASLRLAIANIHRPGALTPTVVLSLGLGLALLVTIVEIDGNLRRQFMAALPDNAPSFYFLDIPSTDAARFETFIRERAPTGKIEHVPMLRGRIMSANGVRAEDLQVPPNIAWVLQSDRGITYAADIPQGSRLTAGAWWPEGYSGTALVSMEKRIAEGLKLSIGDPIAVNVLGRNITAKLANVRSLDWQSLGINFVLVFSPNTFAGAPHTNIATLAYPDKTSDTAQELKLVRDVAEAFPAVTVVRVKDALDAIGGIVTNLTLAIRSASLVALAAAIFVLGGALAAGHRHRVYDAVILKTLGATRRRLLAAYALEYLLLGCATALFGVAAGSIAAGLVVTEVMNLTFVWLPVPAAAAAFGALMITVVFGLVGTFTALGHKPAPVLRNL